MTTAMLTAALLASLPATFATPPTQASSAAAALFDAAGYRIARYRAPVDRPPYPARTISLEAALDLVPGRDAVFVDVLPVAGGWRDPETGAWRLSLGHVTIPGARWHPGTGRAAIDPVLWNGLLADVERQRANRRDMPVVVFCRVDCWMGWNAARRLASAGAGPVYWLAEGVDGWHARGRALASTQPVTIAPAM